MFNNPTATSPHSSDVPSVVLVGSPDVGKSSIVRAISSGTPGQWLPIRSPPGNRTHPDPNHLHLQSFPSYLLTCAINAMDIVCAGE